MSKRTTKPAPDFVVTADVYGAEAAIFRDVEVMRKWCEAEGIGSIGKVNAANTNACAVYDTDDDGVDWFFAYIPKRCPPETVCHECLHLAWYVLKSKGVTVSFSNHEALAHLQQHLARQILSRNR